MTEAAVSGHVAQLRKELDDPLFTRAGSGLAFTPGGLRLASRAVELLGLADQTVREVSQAGHGRRLLRLSASSLFAEYAAPGLIELFAGRAADLEVELTVVPPESARSRSSAPAPPTSRSDPQPKELAEDLVGVPFLKYQVVLVARPGHQLAGVRARPAQLREQVWLLGPSAVDRDGVVPAMLRTFDVPERNQRIFQNHAAAAGGGAARERRRAGAGVRCVRGAGCRSAGPGRGAGHARGRRSGPRSASRHTAGCRPRRSSCASSPRHGRPRRCCTGRAWTSVASVRRCTSPSGADDRSSEVGGDRDERVGQVAEAASREEPVTGGQRGRHRRPPAVRSPGAAGARVQPHHTMRLAGAAAPWPRRATPAGRCPSHRRR